MDPSTGTFTSMDTYGGSLSDPMSLHKYLFANANPVKYSDPSGHASTLVDQMTACGIMSMMCSATLFWLDVAIHPESEHNEWDYISTLLGGFLSGFIGGYVGIPLLGGNLKTVSGCITLIIVAVMGMIGYFVKKLGECVIDSSNSPETTVLGWEITIFGDILMSPLRNVISFDSDLLNFLMDLGEYIFG